jgi:glycerol uptake facilitator-like aquaporin
MAKAVDTLVLVLFGCGTAVANGDKANVVGLAFAFGFAVFAAVRQWAFLWRRD